MSEEDLHNSCRALTWAVILTIPSNQIVMVLLLLCTQRLRVTAIRGKVLSAWRERRSISIRRRRLRFVPCRLSPSPGYQIDPRSLPKHLYASLAPTWSRSASISIFTGDIHKSGCDYHFSALSSLSSVDLSPGYKCPWRHTRLTH